MMRIASRDIGPGHPVWIVAEMGPNHAGSLERARAIVHAAAEAGADALKLQLYTADEMTLPRRTAEYTLSRGPWAGRTLYELYVDASTPFVWLPALFAEAEACGLVPFASVFGLDSLAACIAVGCPAYKIASAEIVDTPLLHAVALTGKPVILSDGMAGPGDVERARAIVGDAAVLTCVSEYPATTAAYVRKLARMPCHGGIVGLSDHSLDHTAAQLAVALGASIVEKHLMLDADAYDTPPLDAGHSVTPAGFAAYVQAVRDAERAQDAGTSGQWARRWVAARDIKAGELLREGDLRTARAAEGLRCA